MQHDVEDTAVRGVAHGLMPQEKELNIVGRQPLAGQPGSLHKLFMQSPHICRNFYFYNIASAVPLSHTLTNVKTNIRLANSLSSPGGPLVTRAIID